MRPRTDDAINATAAVLAYANRSICPPELGAVVAGDTLRQSALHLQDVHHSDHIVCSQVESNVDVETLARVEIDDGQRSQLAAVGKLVGHEIHAPDIVGTRTAMATRNNFPTWSPQGDEISFSSDREYGDWEIYAIRPDGTVLRRITHIPAMTCTHSSLPRASGSLSQRSHRFQ